MLSTFFQNQQNILRDEELKVDFTDFKIKVQRKSLLLN